MPHVVVLEGVEVEMLRTVPEVASRELDLAPLAVQMHLEVRLRELSAERGVGPVEAGVAAHAHALRAEVMDVSGPALKRGQMELGALGQCDFGRADVHALSGLPVRDVLLDDRGVRPWGERQNHVWEGPEIGRLPREEKLDRPRHLHVIRHVHEGPAVLQRGRECREPALVGAHRAAQVALHERGMGARRLEHGHHDDAELLQGFHSVEYCGRMTANLAHEVRDVDWPLLVQG